MNLPAQRTDVWTPATDGDKLKALALLGALPARQALSPDVEDASYLIALDGVTKYGLEEAVRFILRGSLKHAFFPNPAELRQECDKAMEWPEREAERIRRREAINADREPETRDPSPDEKARVQALLDRFYASNRKVSSAADEEAERAEIRARYGITPEAVASIKDQPLPSNFKQVGSGR